jgi:hypothetical protein
MNYKNKEDVGYALMALAVIVLYSIVSNMGYVDCIERGVC